MTDRPLPVGRLVVFVLLAAYIAVGPAFKQLYGGRSPLVRGWVMYRAYGTAGCDVRFYQRTETGDVRLDRFALLEEGPWYDMPVEQRRITSRAEVQAITRDLCNALGPGADLRIDARCGGIDGWQTFASREANLCR